MILKKFLIIAGMILMAVCGSSSEPQTLSKQELEPFYVYIILKYPDIAKVMKNKYSTWTAPYAYWTFSEVKDKFIKKLQLAKRITLTDNQVDKVCNLVIFISNNIPNSNPKATMSTMFFAAKYASSAKVKVDEVVLKQLDATKKIKSEKKRIDILEMILNLGLLPSTYQIISSNKAIYKDISQIMNDFNSEPKEDKLHLLVYGLLLNYFDDKDKIKDIYSESSDYDYESTYNLIDFMTREKISNKKEFYKWLKSFKYSKDKNSYYKRYVEFSQGKGPIYRRMIKYKNDKRSIFTINSSNSPSFYENDPNRQYLAFVYLAKPQIFKSVVAEHTWTAPFYTAAILRDEKLPPYFNAEQIIKLLDETKLTNEQIGILWKAVPLEQNNSFVFLINLVNIINDYAIDKKYAFDFMKKNTEKLTNKNSREWLAREYRIMSKEIDKKTTYMK